MMFIFIKIIFPKSKNNYHANHILCQRFSQPFHVAARFSGLEGIYIKIADTVRSFKAILDGEADDLPEAAFMYVGTIEEARKKAESLKK